MPTVATTMAGALRSCSRRLPCEPHLTGIPTLSIGSRPPGQHNGAHGPARRMLKLLVEIDSSRFLANRLGAGLLLVVILAGFAAVGYGLPALLSRYF